MQKLAGKRISRHGRLSTDLPSTPCDGKLPLPVPACWFWQGLTLLSLFHFYLGTSMDLLNRLSKSQYQCIRGNCAFYF